jgi:hypothetical protein
MTIDDPPARHAGCRPSPAIAADDAGITIGVASRSVTSIGEARACTSFQFTQSAEPRPINPARSRPPAFLAFAAPPPLTLADTEALRWARGRLRLR